MSRKIFLDAVNAKKTALPVNELVGLQKKDIAL